MSKIKKRGAVGVSAETCVMKRPAARTARIGARSLAAVLLLALVALPMACRTRRVPESPPRAEAPRSQPVATEIHTPQGDQVCDKVEFNQVPLPDVITVLGKQAGLNVQCDPDLLSQPSANGIPLPPPNVTERWKKVTPLQALQALLDNYDWQITQSPGSIFRIGARDPKAAGPLRTKVNLLENAPTNGAERVEVSFTSCLLLDAIRTLALHAELNIQFEPGLASPPVTEKWKDVTARQVLQALLGKYGLKITRIPGNPILRIGVKVPKPPNAIVKPAQANSGSSNDVTSASDPNGLQLFGW